MELDVDPLLAEVVELGVRAGSGDIPWAWLALAESVSDKIRTKYVNERGRTKERTIDEQFPLTEWADRENRVGQFRQIR
jgi:hypothetical protein